MTDNPLDRLARRASADPTFLGFHLAAYARGEGLDDAGLADRLGCPVAALANVRLCWAPRSDAAGFREDVTTVATKFGVRAAALAAAVRHSRAVLAVSRAPDDGPGVLLAARDRDPPKADA